MVVLEGDCVVVVTVDEVCAVPQDISAKPKTNKRVFFMMNCLIKKGTNFLVPLKFHIINLIIDAP